MAKPPQARSNGATVAEQMTKVFQLKLSGWSHDRIAAELGISHGTVANRLDAAITDLVGPAAHDYVDAREAELVDLFARAYRLAVTATDPDAKLKAIDRCVKINESRRKLRGADAPEAMEIALDRRNEVESEMVSEAIIAAMADLSPAERAYRLELAARRMIELDGGTPEGPPPERPEPDADARPDVAGPYKNGTAPAYVVHNGRRYRDEGEHRPADLPALEGEVVAEYEDDAPGTPGGPSGARMAAILAEADALLAEEDDDEEDEDGDQA